MSITPGLNPAFIQAFLNMTPAEQADLKVRQLYGYMAWALDVPELHQILDQAATEGWDELRLQGALEATQWWKTHSATQRGWQEQKATDPASAQAKITTEKADIAKLASSMGITLSDKMLGDLADQAIGGNWDAAQVHAALASELHFTGPGRAPNTSGKAPAHMENGVLIDDVTGRKAWYGPNGEPAGPVQGPGQLAFTQADGTVAYYTPGNFNYAGGPTLPFGQAGTDLMSIKKLAADYLVPISDATAQMWVQNIASGQTDLTGFESFVREQAKSLFPSMAAAIDSGVTVAQYTDPYKQIAAQTLEVAPDSINMMDPRYMPALNQIDPKTGQRTAMSLSDFQTMIRTDPKYGYQDTAQAKGHAYDMVKSLETMLGKIA